MNSYDQSANPNNQVNETLLAANITPGTDRK